MIELLARLVRELEDAAASELELAIRSLAIAEKHARQHEHLAGLATELAAVAVDFGAEGVQLRLERISA